MTIDASRPEFSLPDWINGAVQRFRDMAAPTQAFDDAVTGANGRDVSFEHDPQTTRISEESSFRQRTTYTGNTEVSVAAPGHDGAPIPVTYHANMVRSTATPEAMQALNPMDPQTWPPGTSVELRGGDFTGTAFEQTFRTLAEANGVENIDDVRLVISKSTITKSTPVPELRIMSGPAHVFDAPFETGPGSPATSREDFGIHTLVQRDPGAADQRAALNHLLVTGTQPDGSIGVSETVTADTINGLITDVASGEVNDVTWTFDGEGRPVHAEGTLTWTPGSSRYRDGDRTEGTAQSDFRTDNGLGSEHHTGHIFAYRFVHGHGPVNMFPQQANFNTGPYARMEQEWADWLDHGMEVDIRVELAPAGAQFPEQVTVDYTVTDPESGAVVYDPRTTVFDNEAGQYFDSISQGEMDDMIGRVA
ncbi:MAG: DNA/RNA non-specific endonuclease [Luteimonas sp.]